MSSAPGPFRFSRRLETPTFETLQAHYEQGEALSRTLLKAEAAVIVLAIGIIATHPTPLATPLPWLAAVAGGVGVFRWLLGHFFLNKKRIEEIRPDAVLGMHTRDSLVRLADTVFARLGIPRHSVPVFMTREKDINAAAVRCELWPGKHMFNGVFLNRSLVHLLDEEELATIIGHELGHVRPYAPLLSRCYLVHSITAATVAMAATCLAPHPGVAVVSVLVVLTVLDRLVWFAHSRLSRGIEMLCDSFGALAAGFPAAFSAEMKVASEVETRQALLQQVLEARERGVKLGIDQLLEAYNDAVPFGRTSQDAVRTQLEAMLSSRARENKGLSLGGFLEHLGGSNEPADGGELKAKLELMRACQTLPLVPVDREAYLSGPQACDEDRIEPLVNALENHPGAVLFRLEHELDDSAVTHPNPSRRILFLWRNRDAIQRSAAHHQS